MGTNSIRTIPLPFGAQIVMFPYHTIIDTLSNPNTHTLTRIVEKNAHKFWLFFIAQWNKQKVLLTLYGQSWRELCVHSVPLLFLALVLFLLFALLHCRFSALSLRVWVDSWWVESAGCVVLSSSSSSSFAFLTSSRRVRIAGLVGGRAAAAVRQVSRGGW